MSNRRKFLTTSAAALLGAGILKSKEFLDPALTIEYPDFNDFEAPKSSTQLNEKIYPKMLKAGSTVAITAPASPTNQYEIRHSVRMLKNLGCKVIVGDTIKNPKAHFRYFSDSEQSRATEFMSFVEDSNVDAILCGRGGYGVMRILDLLDFEKIKANPKPIIGFSDITALLNPIYQLAGVVSFHGPVASSTFDSFTESMFKKVLFEGEIDKGVKVTHNTAEIINPGKATGKLVGGNLKMIVSTLRTPYEIDTDDSILFLEDIDEHPYKIDRMLTQLKLAGKLDNINGFLLGQFKGVNKRHPYHPNNSFTLKEVVDQILKPLGKPILLGMPFGHVKSKLTLPIGVLAEMDADNKSLELLEKPVIS